MRRDQIWGAILGSFVVGLGAAGALQAAPRQGACAEIRAACEQAGFVQDGAKTGDGLHVDCIAPIMRGTPQPRGASKPLPQIDSQLVGDCKALHPNFGQGNAPPEQAAKPPAQVSPPPPVATPQVGPQTRANRPNIVFILTDDLSWNLVQYMPHVLQMQKQGVTFTNYFVTDSLCCPSRSSIFTGRYPHNTGIFRNVGDDGGYLAFHNRGHEQATFATALSAAGYRTAMLGKYLNGYLPASHPPARGWAFWAVAGNGYAGFNYNLNEDRKIVHYGDEQFNYMTDVLSGLGARFIKQGAGRPFMIEIATFAPHAPYTPAPRDADALPGLRAPRTPAFNAAPDTDAPQWLRAFRPLSDADMASIDKDFRKRAQSVLAVDAMIGEVQAAVASIGEQNNTYFVFSSDNGYHMGEHRLMPGKMTAFDMDIRVPLIVTGPGVPAGATVEEIVENVDLCPTFSELGVMVTSANIDGRSLVPLLHGQKVMDWRTVALIEHHGPVRDRGDPDLPAARSGNPTSYEAIRGPKSLYVEYGNGDKEYHDFATDPDELRNSFSSLSGEEQTALHATLTAVQNCGGAQSCSATEGAKRSVTQKWVPGGYGEPRFAQPAVPAFKEGTEAKTPEKPADAAKASERPAHTAMAEPEPNAEPKTNPGVATSPIPGEKPARPSPVQMSASEPAGTPPTPYSAASSGSSGSSSTSSSPTPPPAGAAASGEPTQTANLEPALNIPLGTTRFGIEIGTVEKQDGLLPLWRDFLTHHVALVAGLQARRMLAPDKKWRLIAGPFGSVAEATQACGPFKKVNLKCEATAFAGDQL